MADAAQTLWEIGSQMIVIHHVVQVIYILRWNWHCVILILLDLIGIRMNVRNLLNTNNLLSVECKLALPFLSWKISSTLFKLGIILLNCSLILVIKHLELLAYLAIAWKFSLTIRIHF